MDSLPTVQLKNRPRGLHPLVYRRMVARGAVAEPGALVRLVDREGLYVGAGLFNPRSQIAVRLLYRGPERGYPPDLVEQRIKGAIYLRRRGLQLDRVSDAYRIVHAEADGLSGLVIDRLGDVLVVELFALGWLGFEEAIRAVLERQFPGCRVLVRVDPSAARREGFPAREEPTDEPAEVWIQERGVRFCVDLRHGHKTGFFCDQRDNRARLAELVENKNVLDLCTNCGGFALAAACRGGAGKVLAVDLDERALARAAGNARANAAKVDFEHADAFDFLRAEGQRPPRWDAVILDPSKLARTREELPRARKKYLDLNRLAMAVIKNHGLLLTCSCSGLLARHEFQEICAQAARQAGRRFVVLASAGAASDHPVAPECPESEYLKALFLSLTRS